MDREFLKVIYDRSQMLLPVPSFTACVHSRFELRDTSFGSIESRHELFLVDHPFRVTVDESLQATLQLHKPRFQGFRIVLHISVDLKRVLIRLF